MCKKTSVEFPKTVKEAIEAIENAFADGTDKSDFKETPKADLIKYHLHFGKWIRNRFGLWQQNLDLIKDATGSRLSHPEDASQAIIEKYWEYLNK